MIVSRGPRFLPLIESRDSRKRERRIHKNPHAKRDIKKNAINLLNLDVP